MLDDWDIDRIADGIVDDIGADPDDDNAADLLDDHVQNVFRSVQSRDPAAATAVAELVRLRILQRSEVTP